MRGVAVGTIACMTLVAGCGGGGGGAPQVPDAAAENRPGLIVVAPPRPPVGAPFPVLIRTADGAALDGDGELRGQAGAVSRFALRRGRGSVSLTLAAGEVDLQVSVGGLRGSRVVVAETRPQRRLSGALAGENLRWGADRDVVLEAATVPAGATLVVEPGARVLVEAGANLTVAGVLEARGTQAAPVLFTRAADAPWGGIELGPGARGVLTDVLLTAGGGDASKVFGHSDSQPVVFADGATLVVTGGGAVDNPGKAYSSRAASVSLQGVLVSRCDQGGEHNDSELMVERSHFLELPDGDGQAQDEDNDGIYLSSGTPGEIGMRHAVLKDVVFAAVEDDGVDHAGVPTLLDRVWIEGALHEGVAASNGSTIQIVDSVIRRCQQGIEAGWGAPMVRVEHTTIVDVEVGLRWGDEYPMPSMGTLAARHVFVGGSRRAAVLARWEGGGVDRPEAITAACSVVGATAWAGRDGNVAEATLESDGCASKLLPGCPDGPPGPRGCKR